MRDVVLTTSLPHVRVCVHETPVEMGDDTRVLDVPSEAPTDGTNISISQHLESEQCMINSLMFSLELSRGGQSLGPAPLELGSATHGSAEGIGGGIGPILPSVSRQSEPEDVVNFGRPSLHR